MTQERITYIKMADGRLAPVEYQTEASQQSEEVRRFSESVWNAGQAAIKSLLSKGIPAVYLKGKDLIRLYPDGHEEIIKANIIP